MASRTPSRRYRLTKYSVLWIAAAIVLIPYEIAMIVQGKDGGPLTHVVKWAYGEPGSVRWWLLGCSNSGFLLWLVPHFLLEDFGLKPLLLLVTVGFLVGLVGAHLTR